MEQDEVRTDVVGDEVRVFLQFRALCNQKAEFAKSLMKQLAICSAVEDGEDKAGRSKSRLQTPNEVVQRAAEISDKAFDEFEKRGWLLAVPGAAVLEEKAKEAALLREKQHRELMDQMRADREARKKAADGDAGK